MHTDIDAGVLLVGLQRLVSENSDTPLSDICKKFKNVEPEDWSKKTVSILIDDLSNALLEPTCTSEVATRFPQLVVPLLSLIIESSEHKGTSHKRKCVALGKLVTLHPDALRCAVKFFENNGPPWEDLSDVTEMATPGKKCKKDDMSDLDVALTCLNFLQASASHFRNIWKWSSFIKKFIDHECFKVRWAVCRCVTIVTCMDETQYYNLINKIVTPEEHELCLLEVSQITSYSNLITNTTYETTGDSHVKFATSKKGITQLFQSTVTVSGITLPVFDIKKQVPEGSLALVQSTVNNLRSAALGVACGKAVCLMGPVGCGKTAIVEHLADVTGRVSAPHLLKVQMGDETDAKMLLGSYHCTDVPGEFIWQPGVLTQAVLGGHWLLLEDIDSAPSDVVAVLACLLETGTISVPGFKDSLTPTPGFQIFFTYRLISNISGNHQQHSMASELLQKNWLQVNVEPLSKNELIHIVQVKFPALKTIAAKMVMLYLMFSSGDHEELPEVVKRLSRSGRQISTRDLMKWCSRAVNGFNVSSTESALKVLQDAIDIFCCSVGDRETRVELARKVAACLGIVQTKADFFCTSHKPNVNLARNTCTAGRAILPVLESDAFVYRRQVQTKFAFTRPASCLIERVAVCLSRKEPVLLVGETGTGKTSTLQLLAHHTGHKLVALNMNQQSDSTDLLGGFKPVDMKQVISPIRDEFEALFRGYFSVQQNLKFLEHISICFTKKRWDILLRLMKHSQTAAVKRLMQETGTESQSKLSKWCVVGEKINKLEIQLKQGQMALAFTFVEGTLIKAIKEGHWVLLDEINLASAEALQCLSSLLEGGSGSLSLLERGDTASVPRHSEFRLMAAMNPTTDVGKKDLPPGIRNRFTELFVDELADRTDLCLLVSCYLPDLQPSKVDAVVKFYLAARSEAEKSLCDATGHKPHYSLRTLCRALAVASHNPCGNIQKSLHSALSLSFLTQLDTKSHQIVQAMINRAVIEKGDIQSVLKQPIPEPSPPGSHTLVEGYWVANGKVNTVSPKEYILTLSVRHNLQDLVRSVSLSLYPILLQGDTCVGKTSLITYLAKTTGNKCVRINNHEHTDLQEYIGSYCADPSTGNLVFREGVLVEAMRQGYWIILDELNLAPTDVLEALNRVLDDNRELYIPETQQTIKADPHFRLFATQNPPGLYGGRKVLSRAFRNRFIELHFNEIPGPDLEIILQLRCDMPASYSRKLVAVMSDLQTRRRGSAAFSGKQGFITLRDLFRWGERYRLANQTTGSKFYDWDQHLADEGYLVLAGRVRKAEEHEIIRQVIQKHVKRKVDPEKLFTLSSETSPVTKHILEKHVGSPLSSQFKHIYWTFNLRRLAVLIGKAFEFNEPVLLVGETGCGKTTVSQLIAYNNGQKLLTVNCHQHSESSDFLGGLRPVRDHSVHDDGNAGRLFEWVDGPLIEAMTEGQVFLADEISLADDSVLERLNSLLEPERKLLLSEKGTGEEQQIIAAENFMFLGTMNPGGDFGKKELSPALRNRLTEIWCECVSDRVDWINIIEHNVRQGFSLGNQEDATSGIGNAIMDFITWFKTTDIGKRITVSVRDILMWVQFINTCALHDCVVSDGLDIPSAYIHGACLTLIDSLGAGSTGIDKLEVVDKMRQSCLEYLTNQMQALNMLQKESISYFYNKDSMMKAVITQDHFGIPPFFIKRGDLLAGEKSAFTLGAGTTCMNACRVLRGLQLSGRAILLEGSPGVGKTSLVTALAQAAGYPITRINLSDQTDVSDLFGADLPVEGAPGGTFAWRDGPLLRALKNGHWILLDELNLASQSVLEGLNAVLDHRGELFIPELGKTFHVNAKETKLFACQNPLRQGGARRGLPQSFLNRFTQVFIDHLTSADLLFIISALFPKLPSDLIEGMVRFNERLSKECGKHWAIKGTPWEMNLRDLTRWAQAMKDSLQPGKFVGIIYADRMRTIQDKQKVLEVYAEELGENYPYDNRNYGLHVTTTGLLLGDVLLPRMNCTQMNKACQSGDKMSSDILTNIVDRNSQLLVLRSQLPVLRSLAICVENNWMAILVGKSGSGKTSVVRLMSQLCGRQLRVLAVNSAMDTTEILGGFEQADHGRHLDQISELIGPLVYAYVQQCLLVSDQNLATDLLSQWEEYTELTQTGLKSTEVYTLASALQLFEKRIAMLILILNRLGSNIYTNKLHNDLNILLHRVKSEHGLNTGGTFEWVDSILVKCLQEGSWLLIDNVNLCSCAVLDRLNALLEPGGVLSLGERGVDNEGNVVTIKPHADFRLFLAMDPRHGEISRAMRNRGVEICLLSPEEEPFHLLDLQALLCETGLTHKNHQTALKNIHNAMVEHGMVEFGFNNPTVNNLLHTATLIVQYWLRGQPLTQSFETCCKNIYVKARHFTLEHKQRVFEVLSEVLKSQHSLFHEYNVQTSQSYIQSDLATVHTLAVQESSSLAMLKQQGAIFAGILKALSSNPHQTLTVKDLLDTEFTDLKGHSLAYIEEVELSNIIHHVLLSFYSKGTKQDITTRKNWIEYLVKINNFKNNTTACTISNSLSKLIIEAFSDGKFITDTTSCILLRDELPWDMRRALPWSCSPDWSLENKIILLMHLIIQNQMNCTSVELTATDKKKIHWKNMKVSTFSSAINNGELSELAANDIAVIEFSPLISRLNEFLFVVLTSDLSQTVNCEQFGQLLTALHWKNRLATVGESHLFAESSSTSNLPQVSEHVLRILKIHYKWLIKWLFPQLLYLIGNEKMLQENEVTVKLLNTVSHIESSVYNNVSPLLSVAKSVGNVMKKPLPRISLSQAEATQTLIRLQKAMNIFEGISNVTDLHETMNFVVSVEGKECRMKLVKALVLLQENDHCIDKVTSLLKDIEDECLKHQLIKSVYHKKNDQAITTKKKFIPEVAFWPICEVFFLYLSNAFRNFLASEEESGPSNVISGSDLVTLMLNWSQSICSVPPNLVASLHVAKNNIISTKNVICSFSLMTALMQQYIVSTPFKNFRLWLHWNNDFSKCDTDEDEIMGYDLLNDSKENLSMNSPLISLFVTSLISQSYGNDEETSLEVTSLTSCDDKRKLVTSVKDMLWRSGPAVATHYFGNGINEELCIRKLFNKFITSLKVSLQAKGYLKEFCTEESEIMHIIDPVLNALRLFVDTRRTKQYLSPVSKNVQKEDCVTIFSDNVLRLRDKLQRNQSCVNKPHEQWMAVSEAWVLLGLVNLQIFSCIDLVDPVYKKELKLQYAIEERQYLKHTLLAEELQSIIENTEDFTFKPLFEDRISCLVKTEEALKKSVAVRPDSEVFTQLYRELVHITTSICSSASVTKLLDNLKSLNTDCNQINVNRCLKEAEGWIYSVTRSITNLHSNYTSWFPDIIVPVINSLTEMNYGIHLMSNTVHKLFLTHGHVSDIPSLIMFIGQFPIPDIETALKMIEKMCLSSSLEIINKAFIVKCKEEAPTTNKSNTLAKICLHELSNVIAVQHSLEGKENVWGTVCSVLKFVVKSWQKQEELRKQKQQEEESYFINKVRKPIENLTEEEELELDMKKWFPTQKYADFGDLEGPLLDEKNKLINFESPESERLNALTNKEMNEICQIHTNIITQNTSAHWIHRDIKHSAKADFMTTFLDRFSLFGMLLESYSEICHNDIDHKVLPALCVATNNFISIGTQNTSELHVGKKQYDFYHHSNVSEVKECIPILKGVTARVIELLAEWPDHPTLNQINIVIDRIQNFSITSPVSRFLTGLELLLTKMHEWEENAHAGVSLATYIATVTNQILKWRKLELACWKGSLESLAKRIQEDTSKWWFHLYCLVTSYDENDVDKGEQNHKQLVIALEQFMESSVLGDFQARLNLLYTFHCQALNSTSHNKDQISTIFWNLYQYYSQFSTTIKSRLQELTLPVEKKLRDYVKIAKWNDINYWSVKGTIEKTHRTLLKYIKEHEALLKQVATGAMMKLQPPLKLTGELKISPDLYIANIKLKEMVESRKEDVSSKLNNNLSRGKSLFLKARKLCKELILCSETSNLVYTVDCIADDVYDSSQELKNLDVNRTLPKEKQKSEAKSILQRKRKNLSDIFKTLQTMGLSYRAGIIVFSDDTEGSSSFATIPPLDIEAALVQIESRSADRDLLTAWKGCNEYYFYSVALLAQLQAAVSKPHKDIGPPIIERCKGFTMHLMKLCQDQKKQATDSCQHLYMLRCQIKQLSVSLDDNIEWPKESPQMLLETKAKIITTLNNSQYCLQQFLLVLDACPEQETHIEGNTILSDLGNKILPDSLMSSAMCAYKYDSVWQEIKSSVNDCINLTGKIKNNLTVPDKSVNFIENLKKINPSLANNYSDVSILAQYSIIVDSLESLSDVKNCVSKVISLFQLKLKHEKELDPLTECLFILKNNIDKCLTECKSLNKGTVNQEWTHIRTRSQIAKLTTHVICDYENTIDGFISTLLIVIQELYKRNVKTEISMKNSEQKETDFANELVENHLKGKVVNNIFAEIKLLKMETVNQEIINVTKKLATMVNWDNRKICKGVLMCCLPLLEQYYLLSQYLVTQQVAALKTTAKLCSNLLSIFTDLALKGFRIPEDLLDEGEEGESQILGGMGLGEGEGEKDVSDQIESQDQLEDAKPAGHEKEEEDKECKEEEKGIEMSDDFGGKLQDIEEKEKENSNEESEKEEEEPDKEMGETDQGADTVDQQIWGSDSEEEEEDADENKEEKGNTGEQVGEKEYGPKDGSNEPQDDDDDKNKSENKKKEINEIEEPNEDDDQVDPYHGKHQPEIEPEPLDLPEDLNLDNEEQKDGDQEEENPFDIDAMKEPKLSDDEPKEEEMKESQEKEENPNECDDSDEDDEGTDEKEDIPDTQCDEENADDGGKNDEAKTGDENKPEDGNADDNINEETAKPSDDTPSMEQTVGSDQDAGSKDQVSQSDDKSKELKPEENAASEGPDTQGVGTAEKKDENMEQGTQGSGATKLAPVKENEVHESKKRQRPGESDDQRALGNINEPKKKKLKTISKENESQQNKDETQESMEQETSADTYQHIKEAKDVKYDAQTLDTATDEQAEKQPKLKEDEEEEGDSAKDDQIIIMEEDESSVEPEETPVLTADEFKEVNDKQKKTEEKKSGQVAKDNFEGDMNMEVEGEIIQTSTVVRGNESTIHTQLDKLDGEFQKEVSIQELRTKLEEQLASWSQPPLSDEAEQAWNRLCTVTSNLSRDLSEQLRLVLEPTQASRLKGDFRTGRRINMRKVIPYIASQFRKDKIWLRRTKPSKREYQIVLAVDDSSSMADNHSKELAFESLAVVSKALTLLEAGDLCVLSFGEKTKVLHQLGIPFSEQNGARLLQQFSFEQQKTHVGELVNFACTLLSRHGPSHSGNEFAQLLIIVSDGRGVLNEGEAKVTSAVRRAKHQGVFMVFIIVDNPTSKDSILDIRMPKFSGGKLLEISSYMDSFPFPFYVILRDINNLPTVLSDALRQWFELITSVNQ